ncbi:glycosyltransferase [Granulicella sp. WH15]|uniref:glycosyltransferase n=1 Tax=Granulicella sp. WH15 TaxID=2602070 RepID=UPI0013673F54|nr:glycosyltransferase [Granulicella sp. WH15]QHN03109.1 glycosyltransferase [Granulicella sp. WH15]
MRILHVMATVNPDAGGPSESVRVLMSFKSIGYDGEVVSSDDPNAPFLKSLPFPVHALGPVSTTYAYNSKLVPWIKQNRHRFDGIVVNGLWTYGGRAAKQALEGKKPYLVFCHGMLDPYFKRKFPLKHMKKWVYWALAEYWVLRGAYRVLFTTRAESRLAEQSFWLHRWTGHTVPYGASRPATGTAVGEQVEEFYNVCPEVRGKRFILYLGRIHRKKGCDLLIEAFVKLAGQDPELHLVMAGPDQQGWGKDLKEIVRKGGLEDRVHWPGMLKGNVKWGAFRACEAFILPSHQENFGIAVAEALACGRPALLSDQVNIAPEIAEYGAGLMEPDTQSGTENLLSRWIATPSAERQAMSERALVCFDERYDMQRNAETIIRLIGEAQAERNYPKAVTEA